MIDESSTKEQIPLSTFRWHVFPDVFFRKPGFAFDLLEALYAPESIKAIRYLLDIEAQQHRLDTELLAWVRMVVATQLSPIAKRYISAMRKALHAKQAFVQPAPADLDLPTNVRDQLQQWNQLVEDWHEAYESGTKTFQEEFSSSRQKLRQVVSDERFQEAVFLNSPMMYRNGLLPYLSDGSSLQAPRQTLKREQTLMLYLQRCCAKNDTTSFFGPMNYGRFSPDAEENIDFTLLDAPYPPRRRVLLSYWAAEELLHTIAQDQRLIAEKKPIRSALVVLKDEYLFVPSMHQEVPLDILSRTILRLADAKTPLRTISELLHVSLDLVIARAQRLESYHLLKLDLPLKRFVVDPLLAVEEMVDAFLPGEPKTEWERTLKQIRHLVQAFEMAPFRERLQILPQLEQQFTRVVGKAARRGEGQTYSDRLLINEDTSGDVENLVIGGKLYQDIGKRLEASLNILASCALAQQRADQQDGWQQLQALAPFAHASLLNLYLRALTTHQPEQNSLPSWKVEWDERWRALLPLDHLPVASLSNADIGSLLPEPLGNHRMLAGPDIMIAARDREALLRGDYKIVLAEVHPLLLPAHKDLSLFYPHLERAWEQARVLLDHLSYPREPLIFASRRLTRADNWPLGQPMIHARWVRGDIDTLPIPLAGITVDIPTPPHIPALHIEGLGFPGMIALPIIIDRPLPPFLSLFSGPQIWTVPVAAGPHTPRIEIDGVVFQRERWDLAAEDLPLMSTPIDSFDTFLAFWRWKRHWSFPEQIFFRPKFGEEAKPILINFLSPLSCISALKVLNQSQGGIVTEMFPPPDQLWLQPNGQRYTSEIRFTAFRMPDTFSLEQAKPLFGSHQLPKQEPISPSLQQELIQYVEGGASFPDDPLLNEVAHHLRFVHGAVEALIMEE